MAKIKFLIFDADSSLSTIGNDQDVENVFGFPPIRLVDADITRKFMKRLFVCDVSMYK